MQQVDLNYSRVMTDFIRELVGPTKERGSEINTVKSLSRRTETDGLISVGAGFITCHPPSLHKDAYAQSKNSEIISSFLIRVISRLCKLDQCKQN